MANKTEHKYCSFSLFIDPCLMHIKNYVSNHYYKAVGEIKKLDFFPIDLFSMYALVSQCSSCVNTLGNCFIQISLYPLACVHIIHFMKRQRSNFTWDLQWIEKKSIQATCNEVYFSSKKWLFTLFLCHSFY